MFYAGDATSLQKQVESCFTAPGGPGKLPQVAPVRQGTVLGLVSPHAGFLYSGSVAACAYNRLAEDGLSKTVVIIGPSHRSSYPQAALTNEDAWRTPLGDVAVDVELSEKIAASSPMADIYTPAHHAEHSLEVQLPFLQYLTQLAKSDIKIVPIVIGGSAYLHSLDFALEMGNCIAMAVQDQNAVIIASSDFTHYESGKSALEKDSMALSAILALDEEALLSRVEELNITMCGALPIAVTMVTCKKLGARVAKTLAYRNSGDVTGDYSEVVGYAAVEIDR